MAIDLHVVATLCLMRYPGEPAKKYKFYFRIDLHSTTKLVGKFSRDNFIQGYVRSQLTSGQRKTRELRYQYRKLRYQYESSQGPTQHCFPESRD